MYKVHSSCRACGYASNSGPGGIKAAEVSERLQPVFDLGIQPLANDFTSEGQEQAGYYPLKVMLCPRCGLAQLSVVVRPDMIYRNYPYVTSPSQTMKDHFAKLAKDIQTETTGTQLLEIGSNDGALLEDFSKRGFHTVLGIDPAQNLCAIADNRGVKSVCNFFSPESAKDIAEFFRPDVILARHVLCHIPDWKSFIEGIKILSSPDTLTCIEVPYVGDLLARGEFDTIYHEHLSFMSVRAFNALLKDTGLELVRIIRYPIHGGAILMMIRPACSHSQKHISVREFLDEEAMKMTAERWKEFSVRAQDQISNLKTYVRDLVQNGKRVAALGASAKSTVWINACGFTRNELSFIADETPQKQWKRSPGSTIPIVDEGAILRDLPDYVIVFCWNFRDEVLRKTARAREKGVKFIFPVPKIEIV